jgi:hypothetical protein
MSHRSSCPLSIFVGLGLVAVVVIMALALLGPNLSDMMDSVLVDATPEPNDARVITVVVQGNPPTVIATNTPALSALSEQSVTPEATATRRPSRTPTDEPTKTQTPIPSSTPKGTAQGSITSGDVVIRSGPGKNYPKVGTLQKGATVFVSGRTESGKWLEINVEDGSTGWVFASFVDTAVPHDTVAIAAKIPKPPTPIASPTPKPPKPTLTIDEQIDKVAKGQHGDLPQPPEIGGVAAGGEAEVTILNDTPYKLTVLVGSPSSKKITVEACGSCKVYLGTGPLSCQEEGRPEKTVRLQPGNSEVVARVNNPGVIPFYGTWELRGDAGYFFCFFVVQKTR